VYSRSYVARVFGDITWKVLSSRAVLHVSYVAWVVYIAVP